MQITPVMQGHPVIQGPPVMLGPPIIQGKPVVREQPIPQGGGNVNLHTQQIKGHTSINVSIDPQDSVLLQNAKVCAINPNEPQCMFNVRIIFDGRVQRSYITQELKDLLNLPVLKRDLLLTLLRPGGSLGTPKGFCP